MNLMENEAILETYQSGSLEIILTTYRIRKTSINTGNESIISLMLDEVTSCKFVKEDNPFLFFIAVSALLIGIFGLKEFTSISLGILIVGAWLLWWYYHNRHQGFKISTPSASIWIESKTKNSKSAGEFIDKIETAKFAIRNNKVKNEPIEE